MPPRVFLAHRQYDAPPQLQWNPNNSPMNRNPDAAAIAAPE